MSIPPDRAFTAGRDFRPLTRRYIAENEEGKLKEVGGRTYIKEVECIVLLLAWSRLAVLLCIASPDDEDCADKGTGMPHAWRWEVTNGLQESSREISRGEEVEV